MKNQVSHSGNKVIRSNNIDLPSADCPWRRLFARVIDIGCYWLLWYIVAFFILQWDETRRIASSLAIAIILMLFIEPLLIMLVTTTPGKALFGIRVTGRGGSKLTVFETYARMWGVLSMGMGLLIIPVYNLYRLYKSYKTYMNSGELPWDVGLDYIIKSGNSGIRMVSGVLCILLMSTALFLAPYIAAMPPHRGNITLEQFAENVNRSIHYTKARFSFSETIGMRYDGVFGIIAEPAETWIEHHTSGATRTTTRDTRATPQFTIVKSNGYLSEIGFAVTDFSPHLRDYFMNVLIYPMFYGFVGAQEEMNFLRMALSGAHRNIDRQQMLARAGETFDYSFVIAGVEVSMSFFDRENMIFNMRKIS